MAEEEQDSDDNNINGYAEITVTASFLEPQNNDSAATPPTQRPRKSTTTTTAPYPAPTKKKKKKTTTANHPSHHPPAPLLQRQATIGTISMSKMVCQQQRSTNVSLLTVALAIHAILYMLSPTGTSTFVSALSNIKKDNNTVDDGFDQLVGWMKRNGGRVHPGIQVGTPNGIRGIVSTAPLNEGDEILFCPWKLVIGSTSLQDQMKQNNPTPESRMCQVVLDMADEIRLGVDSLWFPYLTHIELPRLPATWHTTALEELQGLAPYQDATRHIQWFQQQCNTADSEGELDQATMRSLVTFISRASEVGMIPIYDLLNHHNGKRNAKLKTDEDGVHLNVVGGSIPKGNELYLSYGVKSAAAMYRDYGFVEEWPCIFNFQDLTSGDNFAFAVFPDDVVAINPTSQFLKGLWLSNMPLVEYQASAQEHMETINGEDLIRFAQAARTRLSGLPTTVQEDATMIEDKTDLLRQTLASSSSIGDDHSNISHLEDVLSAIQFRHAFKASLEKAASLCETMLAQRARTTAKHEL